MKYFLLFLEVRLCLRKVKVWKRKLQVGSWRKKRKKKKGKWERNTDHLKRRDPRAKHTEALRKWGTHTEKRTPFYSTIYLAPLSLWLPTNVISTRVRTPTCNIHSQNPSINGNLFSISNPSTFLFLQIPSFEFFIL